MEDRPKATNEQSPHIAAHRCGPQRYIGYGIALGIVLGALVGLLFQQTVNGMILGFAFGMGLGGVLDARNKRRR